MNMHGNVASISKESRSGKMQLGTVLRFWLAMDEETMEIWLRRKCGVYAQALARKNKS